MTQPPEPEPMYDAIGRLVAVAAEVEHALTSLAEAVLSAAGLEGPKSEVHGKPPADLLQRISTAANTQPEAEWSQPALELRERARTELELRNALVHGQWFDLEPLMAGPGYKVLRPRKRNHQSKEEPEGTRLWRAYDLDRQSLLAYVDQLRNLRADIQALADQVYDQIQPPPVAAALPATGQVLAVFGVDQGG